MTGVPVQREFYQDPSSARTLNQYYNMTDAETDEQFVTIHTPNVILDVINGTIPSSTNWTTTIVKNGNQTPIRLYSQGMNPSTAGRMAQGPIALSPGQYQFKTSQTSGTASSAKYGIIVKFAHPL